MRISEFIERSNKAGSAAELFALLVGVAGALGYDRLAYGVLSGTLPPQAEGRAPAVVLNYPGDWVEYYFEQGFQALDPVVRYTPLMPAAYPWRALERCFALDREEVRVMQEAREAGLRAGISVPLHGPWGTVKVVSFASSSGAGEPERQAGQLQALAAQFSVAYTALARAGPERAPPQLSQREKDCLCWAAHGKSSWDIGMILGISEFTVNFHLKKAMRKLGTSSRVLAVVKAIRYGLIHV
ncbi:MAG: LuxR family transcriptional regulator [Kiloniellales bacterium]